MMLSGRIFREMLCSLPLNDVAVGACLAAICILLFLAASSSNWRRDFFLSASLCSSSTASRAAFSFSTLRWIGAV